MEGVAPARVTMPLEAWADKAVEPELCLIPKLVRRDQVAVDVGAARGSYSYYFSRFARACHAFEPNPDSVERLKRRLPSVHVHNVALSASPGTAILRIPTVAGQILAGWASIHEANHFKALPAHSVTSVRVETVSLDEFGVRNVGFIKIDVEGHELEVLKGAKNTIIRDNPIVQVEAEERHRPDAVSSVFEFLQPLGYSAYCIQGRSLTPLIRKRFDPGKSLARNYIFIPDCRLALLQASGILSMPDCSQAT